MTAPWIQTFTGVPFDLLHPRAEHVKIEDVAHALAHICRYTGHSRWPYCPTPDQRILTADLRWVPAGDLKIGDALIGFDETPRPSPTTKPRRRKVRRRYFTKSRVVASIPVKCRVIRLEMEDGSTVTASAEHPWLVATKQSRNQKWVTTEDIATALAKNRKRYMHCFFDVWNSDNSYIAGWLAGMYDGEGYISIKNRRGVQLGIAQRQGLVLKQLENAHRALGFWAFRHSRNKVNNVVTLQLRGGWREIARLLGTIRPIRLIDKFAMSWEIDFFSKRMEGKCTPRRIIKAFKEGDLWCSGIETSSKTYFCEGYASHNSVAQHSVLASERVEPRHARWALLHDAAEAYVGDVSQPLKSMLPDFREVERRVEAAVREAFGLEPPMPEEVRRADSRMLVTEALQLLGPPPRPWGVDAEPYDVEITSWGPRFAKERFLWRFEELMP